MKGVIIKNWIIILRELRITTIIFILAAAFMLVNTSFGSEISLATQLLAPFLIATSVVSVVEYNNRGNWEMYADALPSGRRGSVRGMYIFALSYFVIAAAIEMLLFILVSYLLCSNIPSTDKLCSVALMLLSVPMISSSVTLPFLYKFGYIAYRIAAMIGAGVVVAVVMILLISKLNMLPQTAILFALFLAAVLLFFLSMLLSERLYKTVEM